MKHRWRAVGASGVSRQRPNCRVIRGAIHTDPRQASKKVEHDLVELLVVAVNAVLVGADTFVEIELRANEKSAACRPTPSD